VSSNSTRPRDTAVRHQAFQERGLAGAVSAKHGQAFAGHDLEADLAQHLRAAVMLIQTFDAKTA